VLEYHLEYVVGNTKQIQYQKKKKKNENEEEENER